MEQLNIFLKVVYGVVITFLLNKIFSFFRKPQLYLTYYDVFSCADKTSAGCSVTLTLANKGKDKEKGVEVVFVGFKTCSVVSSDYVSVSATGNSINVDRLLAGQSINVVVLLDGACDLKGLKPLLRSETANGRAYPGRGNEPIGAGPIVFLISMLVVVASFFVFVIGSDKGPNHYFYVLRYKAFYDQGFSISPLSSNDLISKVSLFDDSYPVYIKNAEVAGGKVKLVFGIINTTKNDIVVKYAFLVANRRAYYEEVLKAQKIKDLYASEKARAEIDYRYNALPYPEGADKEVVVAPGKSLNFELVRKVDERLTLQDLTVDLNLEGINDIDGSSFSDGYRFNPAESEKFRSVFSSFSDARVP